MRRSVTATRVGATSEDDLFERLEALARTTPHPIVVGIPGYCGSGKSTLARRIVDVVPGSVRMRGDDFLDPLDLTVWSDVDLDTAIAWGTARDRVLGRAHDQLWHDVWAPNERDFAELWDPRAQADVLI
jgi:pantothenate kinase-related protein Tda10